MRITGGTWRGRRLRAPAGQAVRPTTDRVKEAVFSILGPRVEGVLVVDLCCGAGGLGLEALSRGAHAAVFVDRDRRALAATRANLEACGADPAAWRLVRADATRWLAGPLLRPGGRPWLVLADPPYGSGLATSLAEVLAARARLPGFVAAVLEHGPDEEPAAAGLRADRRHYGTSHLTILRPAGGPGKEEAP